jgi:aarF domain-containing kinase
MSFKFGKNFLKLIDTVNTGLLTANRIINSQNSFGGVGNSNVFVEDIIRKSKEAREKKVEKNELKSETNISDKGKDNEINIKSEDKEIKIKKIEIVDKKLNKNLKEDTNISQSQEIKFEKPNIIVEELKVTTDKTDIFNKNNFFTKDENINVNINNPEINKQENNSFEKDSLNKKSDNITISKIHTIKEEPILNSSKTTQTINPQTDSSNQSKEEESYLIKSDKVFIGKASKIPTTSFSRAMNFGLLGASLLTNSLSMMVKDKVTLNSEDKKFSSYLINESNAERLSRTLCKMRGAALKLGQILSTFEDIVIPEPIRLALERARAEADIMPTSQLVKILKTEYGKNWKENFLEFNEQPFAAASIGQVHEAIIPDGTRVAVKVQYPGVAHSIDSDLQNLKRVFDYFKLFPKGMYIDDLIKNLGNELRMECDYIQEAEKQLMFKNLLEKDPFYYVPRVINTHSTNLILCSEFVEGVNIDELENLPQSVKDIVGEKILELTLRELFEFKFMQTDPNPANFFYDHKRSRINLIDFGAARYYEESFVDKYMKIVHAAAINDNETIIKMSKEIGFLTGMESKIMLDSHTQATLAIGEPFNISNKEDVFDFGNQNLTRKIYRLIPTMLKHRLKAPPTEVYSLHRKLSGAYLICIKLKSRVKSKKLFFDIYDKFYKDKFEFKSLI